MSNESIPQLTEACAVCGQTNPGTLETHHVVPRRYGGSDNPENLVDLCGSCHNAIERIYDDRFYSRLRANSTIVNDDVDDADLGRDIEPHQSPDRELPETSVHITREDINAYSLVNEFGVNRDKLRSIAKDYHETDVETLKEKVRAKYEDQHDKEVTDRTITNIDNNESYAVIVDGVTYRKENEETAYVSPLVGVLHCGYCSRMFLPWEQADCAKHLQLAHRVTDLYETSRGSYESHIESSRILGTGGRGS